MSADKKPRHQPKQKFPANFENSDLIYIKYFFTSVNTMVCSVVQEHIQYVYKLNQCIIKIAVLWPTKCHFKEYQLMAFPKELETQNLPYQSLYSYRWVPDHYTLVG